jgi:parallel beta-helix repeat protein
MHTPAHAIRFLFMSARQAFTGLLLINSIVSAFAASYYVDSSAGVDTNAGTSTAAPWKTLTKVNSKTYVAGDRIYLKAGSVWNGLQLIPKGSGASGNPIIIDLYGSGAKPLINGNGANHNTVYFINQSYWEINNIEVTNNAGSAAINLGDYRGISINGQNGGTLNHIHIKNCNVHDVTGEVKWIGGDTADNATGIAFAAGWDASKRTGGIIFETLSSTTKTKFNDVIIEGCTISKCSFAGISFKQWDGAVHWGVRSSSGDTNWTPHTNVTIQNNTINQSGSSYACNGIYVTDVKTGTIQNNVIANSGTCGIEVYYCDAITIQKNEVYGTVKKAGGTDYNGIDPDKGTTNIVVQYNYSHNNGDGILICNFAGYDSSTIRYNILQNNSRYGIYLHSANGGNNQVYNNVVYSNSASAKACYGYGNSITGSGVYKIRNNIFYSSVTSASPTTGSGIAYDYNCYYGMTGVTADAHKVTTNPLFVSAGSGGTGIGTVGGYKLQSTSPCRNTGTAISSNGGADFWGTTLYNGVADIGADEY